jgi:hypothetical protein
MIVITRTRLTSSRSWPTRRWLLHDRTTEPQDPGGPLTTLVDKVDVPPGRGAPEPLTPEAKRELASQLLRSASTDEGYSEDTA